MLRLHYYKDPRGNFGDDLNPWVWYSLYPEIFDQRSVNILLGIGTLISSTVPVTGKVYVCGSGVGYGKPPVLDERWNFVFVRGPKTAESLQLPSALAITDPGILVAKLVSRRPVRQHRVCYMPHHESAMRADWKSICERAGLDYLDPADDIHDIIFKVASSRLVLADAMHLAIIADALRVPWIPVKSYSHILEYKWQDWTQSLSLGYAPVYLPELWQVERFAPAPDILKSRIKRQLGRWGVPSDGWTPPLPRTNLAEVGDEVLDMLVTCRDRGSPFLSSDAAHHDALRRMETVMDEFRGELQSAGH